MANFCLLIRGIPGAGKSTLAKSLQMSCKVVDPDLVDINSREYKSFVPRQTRNPSERVKMYAFVYGVAETHLRTPSNVVWTQPWSRYSEINLTLRNFAFYFTELAERAWEASPEEITELLPFKFLVAEINTPEHLALERLRKRKELTAKDMYRFNRTCKLFNRHPSFTPYLTLNGEHSVRANTTNLKCFIENHTTK